MNKIFFKYLLKPIVLTVLINCFPVFANDDSAAWQALKEGKAVAIMRHAIAPHANSDEFVSDECATQRNLSQAGRDQAKEIGRLFRANGISKAEVYSSYLCRCVDTGSFLEFEMPALLGVLQPFEQGQSNASKQTQELKDWIKQAGATQTQTNILVTHGFNIQSLVGRLVSQGTVLIVSIEDGEIVTLAQVTTS